MKRIFAAIKSGLHWQIAIGMAFGIAIGAFAREAGVGYWVTDYVAVLGTLFLRALRMVIVPLIVASMISGITGIASGKDFGRLSLKTAGYYVGTSLAAILTGLILVNLIKPGIGAPLLLQQTPEDLAERAATVGDTLLRIIPTNPLKSMIDGDILPVIFFSLLFGFFVTRTAESYRIRLTEWFQALFEVMMRLTQFIIRFAPIGIFALIAEIVAETGFSAFPPLAAYMATVITGLAFHAFITLPLLLILIGKISPWKLFKAMSPSLLTSFSTASSSATLPVTMDCAENRAGISNKVTSFVLPLGATINMDGTALYECVAAMFIAQAYGIEITLLQQGIIVLTALLASIGAAAIPMAGLVMMTIILKAVGLPLEGIGLLLAVDRVLDMMRTSVNNWSDSSGTAIIAKTEGENQLSVLFAKDKPI